MPQWTKPERLTEFFRRLAKAASVATREEAFELLAELLNAVEDEFTSVPSSPENWESDGRMYPPQDDQRRDVEGHPEIVRYRSIGHNTFIGANGAIEIRLGSSWTNGQIVFEKPGADGKSVWTQGR